MFEGLNHINIAGTEYPIKCDLYVLERIQDEYGSVEKFEDGIKNIYIKDGMVPKLDEDKKPVLDENGEKIMIPGKVPEYKYPNMKMLSFGLELMINEGIDIQNEETETKMEHVTARKLVQRMEYTVNDLSSILLKEYTNCFVVKNQQTTQRKEENQNR